MSCTCLRVALPFLLAWTPGDVATLRVKLERADGSPFDLTDAEITCRVASDDTPAATLLWDLDSSNGTAVYDAAAGIAVISPDLARSLALAPRKTYPCAIGVYTPGGERLTFGPGYIETSRILPGSALPPPFPPPPVVATVRVAGAGIAEADGDYTYNAELDRYDLPGGRFWIYSDQRFFLWDNSPEVQDALYQQTTEGLEFPWEGTWENASSGGPVPTFTEVTL